MEIGEDNDFKEKIIEILAVKVAKKNFVGYTKL